MLNSSTSRNTTLKRPTVYNLVKLHLARALLLCYSDSHWRNTVLLVVVLLIVFQKALIVKSLEEQNEIW